MDRVIVLEPAEQGNVGAIARLADNFDVDELVLVSPRCSIGEEARTFAANAQERLEHARVVDDLDVALEGLDLVVGTTGDRAGDENLVRHALEPGEVAGRLEPRLRTGLLFGRESTGLSNAELDRCDTVVSVTTSPAYPVMNLSHAVAVVLHEFHRAGREAGAEDHDFASRADRETLENLFKGVTDRLDWNGSRRDRTVRAFRNVLGRTAMTGREHRLLCGLFSDVRDRLGDDT